MDKQLTTLSTIVINAPANTVWQAITNPLTIKEFMMGMQAVSGWKEGDELRWIGRHEEKPDDNAKGIILKMEPGKTFTYTFYYPGYGNPDRLEFYNTIWYQLDETSDGTSVTVRQGDFAAFENGETFMRHSQQFWDQALKSLKDIIEK